jgi:chorismate mutase
MSPTDPSLDLLRTEIDSIDIAIHDLIVKRGTIVEDIRKIKNGAGPALRPGREATILRGLAERHRGRFPLPALISLWREMMGGFTHMQEPVTVAVHGAPGSDRLLPSDRVGLRGRGGGGSRPGRRPAASRRRRGRIVVAAADEQR